MEEPGEPNPNETRRPSWSERAAPESVRPTPPTRPLHVSQDPDALVPASDAVMRAGYGRTGSLPARPIHRGGETSDALAIHPTTKQTRVLSFEVEGVHWRAGFAPEVAQTPLAQYVTGGEPPTHELLAGNGFVLRPVENDLEVILRDMVPERLLHLGDEMYGRHREPGHTYLYYSPNAQGAVVGMAHWYLPGPSSRTHLLYLQTDVRKAEPRLLDEMQRTFRASFAARGTHGPSARPFDFWHELQIASAEVEASLRASSLGRNSRGVQQRVHAVRETAETQLYSGINAGLGAIARALVYAFVRAPQRLLAGTIRASSRWMVAAIRWADGIAGDRPHPPAGPGP